MQSCELRQLFLRDAPILANLSQPPAKLHGHVAQGGTLLGVEFGMHPST